MYIRTSYEKQYYVSSDNWSAKRWNKSHHLHSKIETPRGLRMWTRRLLLFIRMNLKYTVFSGSRRTLHIECILCRTSLWYWVGAIVIRMMVGFLVHTEEEVEWRQSNETLTIKALALFGIVVGVSPSEKKQLRAVIVGVEKHSLNHTLEIKLIHRCSISFRDY